MVQSTKRKRAVVFRDLQGIGYGFIHQKPIISFMHASDISPSHIKNNVAAKRTPTRTNSLRVDIAARIAEDMMPKLTNSDVVSNKITTWPPPPSQTTP
jgi:hypothetical protein